jgi:hypothetical protein
VPRLKIVSIKDDSIVHVNPSSFLVKLGKLCGVLQETKVLDIQEVDAREEMDRQITFLMTRGLEPALIVCDPRSYHKLLLEFDTSFAFGLSLPSEMGGVRLKHLYAQRTRLSPQLVNTVNQAVEYALRNKGWASTIKVDSSSEKDFVDLTSMVYNNIDLITCSWVDGVVVLPHVRTKEEWLNYDKPANL